MKRKKTKILYLVPGTNYKVYCDQSILDIEEVGFLKSGRSYFLDCASYHLTASGLDKRGGETNDSL